ncbi:toprim domain-containing protein [Methylobacterium sp. J-072]|uniref:toprim domain-containing protein n=1 Tax=Methylobacterium sp. J-072 TaxID=2836651 RepID=UPI001FB87A96|nr:toprim domain-containing protein [Methylobacterium sp. J-072]MCJ2092208.1 toprim domain-containing protein [Methylobacterium sp. J-072]
MIALVRSIASDAPQAIHRTGLSLGGEKIEVNGKDRLALGPLAGGAVKLTADAEVSTCLGVGEGIESVLSLQQLPEFGASPAWALLNTAGVSGFPALSGIECLWLAVDHDPAGERAADACAERWRAAGREVFRVKARAAGADLNDLREVRLA